MIKDLTGMTFGFWEVIAISEERNFCGGVKWLCRCRCGKEKTVSASTLLGGTSTSCRCHGNRGRKASREYRSWKAMRYRCSPANKYDREYYYDLGVCVCPRWDKFENFLTDMGPQPEGKTIDRYPNKDGNYEPGNCRWANASEQATNRRRRKWRKKALGVKTKFGACV